MQVLYFTREYTWHDRRFLDAIVGLGATTGLLTLRDAVAGRERVGVPAGVSDLGGLGVTGQPDEQQIEAVVARSREQFGKFGPDVVHAGPLTDAAYVAVRASEAPVVACSWAFDVLLEVDEAPLMLARAQTALKRCGGLLVDCQAVLDRCRAMAGRSFDEATVLPWGIDFGQLERGDRRQVKRSDLGWSDAKIVLSTRSFEKLYDLPTLLRAFAKASQRDDRLRLALVGDGSERDALQSLAAELGVLAQVRFVGAVSRDEVGDWFAASDLYVSCAQTDGSSISLLEAMASGLLPIVTDLPSNREWVEAEAGGWLVPFGDEPQFSHALVAAGAASRRQRGAMTDFNWRIVKDRADWSKNVPKLRFLYARAIEAGVKP